MALGTGLAVAQTGDLGGPRPRHNRLLSFCLNRIRSRYVNRDPFAPRDAQGIGDPVYLRVRERIRADILSGHFGPGARIKIADVSKRYGVSQMPVREALQMLQGEGLVTIAPNRGASVRPVNESFIGNMYDIRGAIEIMLVRRCVERITESEIFKLHSIEGHYEEAVRAEDVGGCLQYNKQFHHIIYQCAQNPEALEMLESHWDLIESLRGHYGFGASRLEQIIHEHRQLLRALSDRNRSLAEEAAAVHCERAKEDLINQSRLAMPAEAAKLKKIR
jgi:DNA-binding GntR family transcriptional regulator